MPSSFLCAASLNSTPQKNPSSGAQQGTHHSEFNPRLAWRRGPKICHKHSRLKCHSATHQPGGLCFPICSMETLTQVSQGEIERPIESTLPTTFSHNTEAFVSLTWVCDPSTRVHVSGSCFHEASDLQRVLTTGLQFHSKSQGHKQEISGIIKSLLLSGTISPDHKDMHLIEDAAPARLPRKATVVAPALTPLATQQNHCLPVVRSSCLI